MAVLLSDDEHETLQAALAFVDAHFDSQTVSQAEISASRETQRRERNARAAEQTRRKRRSELLRLRDEHVELQATLDALCESDGRTVESRAGDSVDRKVSRSKTRFRKSLALNKRLRVAVEQYSDLLAQISQLLSRRAELKHVQELVREAGVMLAVASSKNETALVKEKKAVFDDLKSRFHVCSIDATMAVMSSYRETTLSDSRTSVKDHPVLGSVVETTSSILVPCSADKVLAFFVELQRVSLPAVHKRDYGYKYQARLDPTQDSFEKEFSLAFKDLERKECVPIEGMMLMGRLETPYGKTNAWSSVVAIPGEMVRIHTRGWSYITSVSPDTCVLHDHFELFCEKSTSLSCHNSKNYKTKFLVESLLEKAQRDRLYTEDSMAQRFGSSMASIASLFVQ